MSTLPNTESLSKLFISFINSKFGIPEYVLKTHCMEEMFFEFISRKYNIPFDKVKTKCLQQPKVTSQPIQLSKLTKKEQNDFEKISMHFINTSTNPKTIVQLKSELKAKGLKLTGTKQELQTRLENPTDNDISKNITRKKRALFKSEGAHKVIEKIRGVTASRAIRKNDMGLYVDIETQFIFDPISSKVTSKLDGNRTQVNLTKEDILKCIAYGFNYKLPENLNTDDVIDKVLELELTEEDYKEVDDEDEESEFEESEDEDV